MDNNLALIIGMLVIVLCTVLPTVIGVMSPIIKLNKSIQKLNDSIDTLNKESSERKEKLEGLEKKVEQHHSWLIIDKKRLDNQSKRLHKIDNEEGFIDTERREGVI